MYSKYFKLDYFEYLLLFLIQIEVRSEDPKEVSLIGTGFQHLIDSYFWYLPFASVRQCKYVTGMDKADIPEDERMSKRAALAEEQKHQALVNR